jgi:hypothetical protein
MKSARLSTSYFKNVKTISSREMSVKLPTTNALLKLFVAVFFVGLLAMFIAAIALSFNIPLVPQAAAMKEATPQPFREAIRQRNLSRYGDELGPAFRNKPATEALTDTNRFANSVLLLPERGLGVGGAVVGGLAGTLAGGGGACQ